METERDGDMEEGDKGVRIVEKWMVELRNGVGGNRGIGGERYRPTHMSAHYAII